MPEYNVMVTAKLIIIGFVVVPDAESEEDAAKKARQLPRDHFDWTLPDDNDEAAENIDSFEIYDVQEYKEKEDA